MELKEIFKTIFDKHGKDVLASESIIGYVSDYGGKNINPQHKRILKELIKAGYGNQLLSTELDELPIRITSYVENFVSSTGYQKEIVEEVLFSIAEGLGGNIDNKNKEIIDEKVENRPINYDLFVQKTKEKAKQATERVIEDIQSSSNPNDSSVMSNLRAILGMIYLTTLTFGGIGFLFADRGWTGGWGLFISLTLMICMYLFYSALFFSDADIDIDSITPLLIIWGIPFILWGYMGSQIEWYFSIVFGVAAILPVWALADDSMPSPQTTKSFNYGGILSMVSFLPLFFRFVENKPDNIYKIYLILLFVLVLIWVLAIIIYFKYFEIIVYSVISILWSFEIFKMADSSKAGIAALFFSVLIMVSIYLNRKKQIN